ncbi:hypothetical protein LOTGIDRAFT_175027 [Lottia gigantea]|uniref:Uncharacterized protein n=1 Tax=Lottia gigantea TaxID=225164 RepID=V4AGB7_LOTGI|nr:hypothetical protein LOTGIDRAFT_175027 [Lottia gigantea]ESO95917.1 hypothetical protein LOTGIDRAFT_175027 [Lottia gigantea]
MIVAHAPKTYFGSGYIQNSLGSLPGFPWAKYAGEKHLPGHNYTGPDEINDLKYKKVWINKAKPYFVDQIGDTLQGDLDMNNFKVTNLKSPENDNDAVHEKYLREQINSIEVNKNHLEDKISNVKRFFKRQLNNKNVVNDTKLQQEVKVDSIFFRQNPRFSNKFNNKKVLQFINGTENVESKEL